MSVLARDLQAQREVVTAAYRELLGAILTDAPGAEVALLARVLLEKAVYHHHFETRLAGVAEAVWFQEHHGEHDLYLEELKGVLKELEGGAEAEPRLVALRQLFRRFDRYARQGLDSLPGEGGGG